MKARKMPEISVIIPAYNLEAYIERCIRSVLACICYWKKETGFKQEDGAVHEPKEQAGWKSPVEILIVNDGSADGTGTICRRLGEENPCIRVITQENGGLSAARNTGVREAGGRYLLFLDGDDELEPETLKTLYDTMEAESLDALFFGAVTIDEPSGKVHVENDYNRPDLTREVMTGEQLFCEMVKSRNYIGCAVLYMVKRALYEEQGLKFVPRLVHEDQVFTPQVLFGAKRAAYRNQLFYRRYNREGSIMRSVSSASEVENYYRVVKELEQFAERTEMEEESRRCFCQHLTGFIKMVMAHYCRIHHPTKRQREYYKEMRRMSRKKEISVSKRYGIYLWLVRMESCPVLGLLIKKTGIVKA